MDVRPCLDVKVEWQGSYSNQVQVLYRFIVLLIVLILLFKILQGKTTIPYLTLANNRMHS